MVRILNFRFFILLSLLFMIPFSFADSDGVFTEAEDIRGGIIGADEQVATFDPDTGDETFGGTINFTFINPVIFNSSVEFVEGLDLDQNLSVGDAVDEDIEIEIISGNTTSQNSFLQFLDGSNDSIDWKIGKDDSNDFFISEQDERRITIEQGGQVGIGSSAPIGILDVNELTTTDPLFMHFRNSVTGPSNASFRITSSHLGEIQFSDGILPAAGLLRYDQEADSFLFRSMDNFRFLIGSSEVLRIDSLGQFGFGNSDPNATLDINTDSGVELKFSGTSSANINSETGNTFFIRTQDAEDLRLGTNDADVLTITSDGNVGIGDTTPDGSLKLAVIGNVGASQYCSSAGEDCFFPGDVSTLGGIPTCTGDDFALQFNGTSFLCTNVSSGASEGAVAPDDLVEGGKTQAKCLADGGSLAEIGADNPLCKFSGSVCPSSLGWVQFGDYSTTSATSCSVSCQYSYQVNGKDGPFTVTDSKIVSCSNAPAHPFSNLPPETCTASTNLNSNCCTATALTTEIGCQ
jgi:hypothetical protein